MFFGGNLRSLNGLIEYRIFKHKVLRRLHNKTKLSMMSLLKIGLVWGSRHVTLYKIAARVCVCDTSPGFKFKYGFVGFSLNQSVCAHGAASNPAPST